MANVLSSWYGYNIFNVANFIDYEPYPKRRKVDKLNSCLSVEPHVQYRHDYELKHKETAACRAKSHVACSSSSSSRPYSEAQQSQVGRQQKKPTVHKADPDVAGREGGEEAAQGTTTIHRLYPEILCLIFEMLDVESKGRAAQVRWGFSSEAVCSFCVCACVRQAVRVCYMCVCVCV